MTLIEDFKEFMDMEDTLKLFDIEICGIKVWERIRFRVYTGIERRFMPKSKEPIRRKSKIKRLKQLLLPFVNLGKNPFLSRRKDILFVCKSRRVREKDGLWWDIYTDPIIQKCKRPFIALESTFKEKHSSPVKTRGLRYLDIIESLIYFKIKLNRVRISFTTSERQLLQKIRDEIQQRYDVVIDIELLVRRALLVRKASLPLYHRLLRRIRPCVVVLAQGYNREDMIEACKSSNIKVIELQHGMIYPFHSGYGFGEDIKKDNFADYVLTWGDYWGSNANFPIEQESIVSVGFPYIELKRNSYKDVVKKRQVVFISQDLVAETLIKYALALSNSQELDFDVVYKLHPGEEVGWREKYPELVDSGIKVVDSKSLSMYDLFAESIIQVGVCSTAIYEGLAFGLQSYVVNAKCVDLMDNLVEREYVIKVTSPEEFLKHIKETKDFKSLHLETFFKENAAENIVEFLDKF